MYSPTNAAVAPWGSLSGVDHADTMERQFLACCFDSHLESLAAQGPPPWAPGRREDERRMERVAANPERIWCMSEVDIFADLDDADMDALAAAAPMKTFPAGSLIYSPHQPMETLFILKRGRVRIFRVSPDGRALTTAIIAPGTIFGEMVIVGQLMHDSFAEALDDVTVCVMSKKDVQTLLLGDPRIAARISETLGRRLAQVEQRLSDAIFKSVPQRIAGTLSVMASTRALGRTSQVHLTHEQLAALAGTSRETTTKILGELAEQGLISLGRGRITIVDPQTLDDLCGD
jgi:CRP/FNR family cyclic AMP-dependent transcriptional regulator